MSFPGESTGVYKKRRIQRACDICRKRKIKCDNGETPGRTCQHCKANGWPCTYGEGLKNGAPTKGYVERLEQRMARMEKVLLEFCKDEALLRELQEALSLDDPDADQPHPQPPPHAPSHPNQPIPPSEPQSSSGDSVKLHPAPASYRDLNTKTSTSTSASSSNGPSSLTFSPLDDLRSLIRRRVADKPDALMDTVAASIRTVGSGAKSGLGVGRGRGRGRGERLSSTSQPQFRTSAGSRMPSHSKAYRDLNANGGTSTSSSNSNSNDDYDPDSSEDEYDSDTQHESARAQELLASLRAMGGGMQDVELPAYRFMGKSSGSALIRMAMEAKREYHNNTHGGHRGENAATQLPGGADGDYGTNQGRGVENGDGGGVGDGDADVGKEKGTKGAPQMRHLRPEYWVPRPWETAIYPLPRRSSPSSSSSTSLSSSSTSSSSTSSSSTPSLPTPSTSFPSSTSPSTSPPTSKHSDDEFDLPPADLARSLIELYFMHINLYFPLLHRPTFDALVKRCGFLGSEPESSTIPSSAIPAESSESSGLSGSFGYSGSSASTAPSTNSSKQPGIDDEERTRFAQVYLLVCALGSWYSDDPRCLLDEEDEKELDPDLDSSSHARGPASVSASGGGAGGSGRSGGASSGSTGGGGGSGAERGGDGADAAQAHGQNYGEEKVPKARLGRASAGWKWFAQVQRMSTTNRALLAPPTLEDLQVYALSAQYLQSTSAPQSSWIMAGIGIRLAQDVGVHRRGFAGIASSDRSTGGGGGGLLTKEAELWKRAFWVLVCIDRMISCNLGRACAIREEDFDLEPPIDCDDEFWDADNPDPSKRFRQPPNKPSLVTHFLLYIELTHILTFSLRTVYSINKATALCGLIGPGWEHAVVSELDSALNKWADSVPDHLKWDPHRLHADHFFNQSASLWAAYYHIQILVHRPFIPSKRNDPSSSSTSSQHGDRKKATTEKRTAGSMIPSLAICTNAARACCHVVDAQQKRTGPVISQIWMSVFQSAVVLLLAIWSGKRSGLTFDARRQMADVYKCMDLLKIAEKRWFPLGKVWDILFELTCVGDLPMPGDSQTTQSQEPSQMLSGMSTCLKLALEDSQAVEDGIVAACSDFARNPAEMGTYASLPAESGSGAVMSPPLLDENRDGIIPSSSSDSMHFSVAPAAPTAQMNTASSFAIASHTPDISHFGFNDTPSSFSDPAPLANQFHPLPFSTNGFPPATLSNGPMASSSQTSSSLGFDPYDVSLTWLPTANSGQNLNDTASAHSSMFGPSPSFADVGPVNAAGVGHGLGLGQAAGVNTGDQPLNPGDVNMEMNMNMNLDTAWMDFWLSAPAGFELNDWGAYLTNVTALTSQNTPGNQNAQMDQGYPF